MPPAHARARLRSAFPFLLSNLRRVAIACVYRLFSRKKISQKHYHAEPDRSIRITAEGKKLLLTRLKKEYEEKRKPRDGLRLTEEQHIRRRAGQLAQSLLRETRSIAVDAKEVA
ncbi:MAG: hypothetical protein KDD10_02190 [Phaeodactylibacter sp.]|nr:hypothetical protein [Phaeodactylibacter sp.]